MLSGEKLQLVASLHEVPDYINPLQANSDKDHSRRGIGHSKLGEKRENKLKKYYIKKGCGVGGGDYSSQGKNTDLLLHLTALREQSETEKKHLL